MPPRADDDDAESTFSPINDAELPLGDSSSNKYVPTLVYTTGGEPWSAKKIESDSVGQY